MTTFIACDGSCIQEGTYRMGDDTDRPGAAAIVIKTEQGSMAVRSESFPNGTIGRMEVYGILMALQFVHAATKSGMGGMFEIRCDSQYAVNGYNQWLEGWAKKGYHKKGGLAHADLWRDIDTLKSAIGNLVTVVWVKGHSGDQLNELADQAANTAARTQTSEDTTGTLLAGSATDDAPEEAITLEDAPNADDYDPAKFGDFIDWLRDLEGGLTSPHNVKLLQTLESLKPQILQASGKPTGR